MYSAISAKLKTISETEKDKPPNERTVKDLHEVSHKLTMALRDGIKDSNPDISECLMNAAPFLGPKHIDEIASVIDHVGMISVTGKSFSPTESLDIVSSAQEESEESQVSISDKLRRMTFMDLENFAEMWVNEIIDISVEVCENLYNAALGEEDAIIREVPCLCQAVESSTSSLLDYSRESSTSEEPRIFSGWPTIKHFNIEKTKKKILEYMSTWYYVENWKFIVDFITSYSDLVSDYHIYKAIWSIPSREYPVAQATATIYFTIEVSRVKPDFSIVEVTLQFESSSIVHNVYGFEFMEQWLFNIIYSKLQLFRKLRF